MKIPKLSDNVKGFFQLVLSKREKTCDGLMYIGDFDGGYLFADKLPQSLKGLCIGLPLFLYVKEDNVYTVDEDENRSVYNAACRLLNSVDENKCYTITLDDENK